MAVTEGIAEGLRLSTEMEGAISKAALRSFVEVAKIDHLVYKFEVYKVFMGKSDKTERDFADHTHCRLGKWYYEGDGKTRFSRATGYPGVEAPHQRFHEAGMAAVRLFRAGDYPKGMDAVDTMETASMEVLAALDRLVE